MKTILVGLIMAGLLSVSGQTQNTAKKAPATPPGLPAAAEKIGEGEWKWKDPQGKSWVYHRTAFGYSRTPDSAENKPQSGASAPVAGLRVVEVKADQVIFEQATPFGKSRWTRPVAEMNSDEKAAFDAHRNADKSAPPAK